MDDLSTVIEVSLLYLGFALAYLGYRRQWLGLTGLVVGYAVFAQLLLTELKVGGVSPKVPAFALALVLAVLHLMKDGAARRRVRLALPIILPVGALGVWALVRDMLAGVLSDRSITTVLSDQGMTLSALIVILSLAGRRHILEFLAWTTTATLMASMAVAALQFFGAREAWDVYKTVRPISTLDPSGMVAGPVEFGGIPGLAASTIHEAYLLLSLGGLALAYFLVPSRQSPVLRLAGLLTFVGFCTVVFLARSRSGTWLMLALAAALYGYLPVRYRNVRFGRALMFSLIGVAALATVFLVLQRSEEYQASDLSKMERIRDADRVALARGAVEEILNAPLLGIGPEAFLDKYGLVAHNTVLNAGTYYGIPGVVILFGFWLGLARVWRATSTTRSSTGSSWMAMGGLFGVIGYNLNGMFHNESVVTGGLLGAFAIGIWVCGSWLEATESRRFEGMAPASWPRRHAPQAGAVT